jgi:hypothetical protein
MRVLPNNIILNNRAKWRFSLNNEGKDPGNAKWSIPDGPDAGSISSDGTYTAPEVEGTYHVEASFEDSTLQATAEVHVAKQITHVSAEQIGSLAEQIYDVAFHEDITQFLDQLFEWLGIPVLNIKNDFKQIEDSLSSNRTLFTDIHLQGIAQGLQSGILIKLTSIIAYLNSKGVTTLETKVPLTIDYLTEKFSQINTQGELLASEVIPVLIITLTRERTKKNQKAVKDKIWGDYCLDPLQASLMVSGFLGSSTNVSGAKK